MGEAMSAAIRRALVQVRPDSPAALHGWLKAVLGIDVPRRARCAGHVTPMAYLEHVFFEKPGDVLVWANRGGGKTFYGAVATLLDLVFKPGIEVRILGGSLDQSAKMYQHLRWMLDRPGLRELVAGKMTQRGVRLTNGSGVELLAQSERSVRGQRVQKLRCDEVELFQRDIWQAAQFVTRSAVLGGVPVRGSVEALSTMHRPFGLMHELATAAERDGSWRLMRWCVLDVMQRCTVDEQCASCGLIESCEGRARNWRRGFVAAEDVIAQHRRVSETAFEAEMLCRKPSRADAVLPEFEIDKHVQAVAPDERLIWVGGMDFGVRSPLVMLWGQLRDVAGGRRLEIVDEYVATDRGLDEHLRLVGQRPWPGVAWIGVDPAGGQRALQTGKSDIVALREAGYAVRSRRIALHQGLELVRRRLKEAEPTERMLVIHPRCEQLIEALSCYHYDPQNVQNSDPVKDGFDHAVDALRYLVVNLESRGGVKVARY